MTKPRKVIVARRKDQRGIIVPRQYLITLPKGIVEAFDWDEHTYVEVKIKGKGILEIRETQYPE